jgi:putative ABC transport system permease protein
VKGVGGSLAPAAAFAFMVLVSVFAAVAVPRQDLHMQTAALLQGLSSAPAAENSVVASAGWSGLESTALTPDATLSAADLDVQTVTLAGAISGLSVPVGPPSGDWSGITSAYVPVSGASRGASAGEQPELEIAYRSALGRHARLITGHLPERSSVIPNPGVALGTPGASAVRGGVFDVALTRATAGRFGLRVGSRLMAADDITLVVTAVIGPVGPASAFWTLDPVTAAPVLGSAGAWMGAVFVGPDEAGNLQLAFGSPDMRVTWDFPLTLTGVTAATAAGLQAHLNTAANEDIAAGDVVGTSAVGPGTIQVSSALTSRLAAFGQTQAAVDAVLSLLLVGLAVIGAVVVVLGVYLLAGHRAGEFAVLRARGAAPWQLAVRALRGCWPAVPAAAAGLVLAIGATPGGDAPLAWWLGGGIVLVALAGPPLIVARRARRADKADEPAAGRRLARRLVREVTLVAAAVGGLALLHEQGPASPGGLDLYTGAAPVLVAVPAALLIMRLYPAALRGLRRVLAARRGVTGFIAMAQADRAAPAAALSAFALVLALGVTAFGGMVRDAVERGQVAASWQATGADAVIDDPAGVTPSAQRAIAAVPGVRHVAAVATLPGSTDSGTAIEVVVVHPASYAALIASTPLPPFPAAALAAPAAAGGPVPVIASSSVAIGFRAGTIQLPTGAGGAGAGDVLNVRVAAVMSGTPALPGQDLFLVLPSWAVSRAPPPSLLLVTGPQLNQRALTAAVHLYLRDAVITFRSAALAALVGSPLQRGAVAVFASGVLAAAGFSAVIVLLSLAIEARDRDLALARLTVMGLSAGQARRMILLEALPAVLAATAAGAACGWALAPLTGSALDLSVLTGGTASVPVRPDLAALAVPAVGLMVLVLAVLSAQTLLARRRRLARILRAGD